MDNHHWANVIREGTRDDEVMLVMQAVNNLTMNRQAKLDSIIIACTQILAQSIVMAPPEVARGIRQGIMTLIDGYATQVAVMRP
jgi:hypothetical protein